MKSFEQLAHESSTPRRTVEEIALHIITRLSGLPGVTPNAIANLVYGWVRQEQPEVLNQLSSEEIRIIVEETAHAN